MKENRLYWKCNNKDQAREIINVLNTKNMVIKLKHRKNGRCRTIKELYTYNDLNMVANDKQNKFIDSLELDIYKFVELTV